MRFLRYSLRRLVFLVPQLIAVSLIVFFLVRLLPGDPAYLIAGQFATKERVEEVRRDLGLDQPLPVQYVTYVGRVLRGDLGRSWRTSQSVVEDIRSRLPATLELILSAGLISVLLGIPIGVYTAVKRRGVGDKVLFVYGMLSGSIPDFWLGLILIFVFFSLLGWLPGPIGRLDPIAETPATVTGMYTIDALIDGNWDSFVSALQHLVLPVATLVLVYMTLIIKNTRSTVEEMLRSAFV